MVDTTNKIPQVASNQQPSDANLAEYRLSDTAQLVSNAAEYVTSNRLTTYLAHDDETHFKTGTRISKDVAEFAFNTGSLLMGVMLGTVIMVNAAEKQDDADTTAQIAYPIAAGLMMVGLFASTLLAHIRQHCTTFDLKSFEDYWLSHLQKGPFTLSTAGGALGLVVSGAPPLIAAGMTASSDPASKAYATGGTIIGTSAVNFVGHFAGGARKYAFKTLAKQQERIQVALTDVQKTLEGFKTMLEMKSQREEFGLGNIDNSGIVEQHHDGDPIENEKTQALFDGLHQLYLATNAQTGHGQEIQKIVQQHTLHSMQSVFGNEFVPLPTQEKLELVEKSAELLKDLKAQKIDVLYENTDTFIRKYYGKFQADNGIQIEL